MTNVSAIKLSKEDSDEEVLNLDSCHRLTLIIQKLETLRQEISKKVVEKYNIKLKAVYDNEPQ